MALTTAQMEEKVLAVEAKMDKIYKAPDGLTGLLPAAIVKISELFKVILTLKPIIARGYDSDAPKDSFHYWGCAIDVTCSDYVELKKQAGLLGITWTDTKCTHPGHLEFKKSLKIEDFQSFKVDGDLKIQDKSVSETNI